MNNPPDNLFDIKDPYERFIEVLITLFTREERAQERLWELARQKRSDNVPNEHTLPEHQQVFLACITDFIIIHRPTPRYPRTVETQRGEVDTDILRAERLMVGYSAAATRAHDVVRLKRDGVILYLRESDTGRVCVVTQFRPTSTECSVELVHGILERGELKRQMVERVAREQAGAILDGAPIYLGTVGGIAGTVVATAHMVFAETRRHQAPEPTTLQQEARLQHHWARPYTLRACAIAGLFADPRYETCVSRTIGYLRRKYGTL